MFAQVLVFLPIKTRATPFFDYAVPPALRASVRPGVLVIVPFRERLLPGVVIMCEAASVPDARPIESVLDPEPVLSLALLELARWMARETLAPLHECVKVMLPPMLRPKIETTLTAQVAAAPEAIPALAAELLRLLIARGPLKQTQLKILMPGKNWRRAMTFLRRRKFIVVERKLLLPQARPQTVRKIALAQLRPAWETQLAGLRKLELYQRVLAFLEGEPEPVEVSVVCAETEANTGHLNTLHKRGLIRFSQAPLIRDPLEELLYTPTTAPALIPDQQSAWDEIAGMLEPDGAETVAPPPVLLLGVTGSGKTEVYLRAAERVLAQGRQAIILTPEISLTPQTVRRFALRFPGQVGVWHSAMSEGERYDTWRRARSGELRVLVGARSALFAPFPNVGLIVLDEEEDASYKQGKRPFYHARETAEELARLCGALFILGSATPSLEAYQRALDGRYRLLQLPRRVLGHRRRIADWQQYLHASHSRYRPLPDAPEACTIALPPVQIVDMRAELQAGNRAIFSRSLQTAVDRALAQKEQVILFLNRRGSATHVFCRDCGWVAACPRCDVPLTLHAHAEALQCHHCGLQTPMRVECPECGSRRVRAFGLGTEGLEERVAERWPGARLQRWDRDVATSHRVHANLLARFARGDADILIGTQMIARGLDFPGVTVVGIISADVGLHLPDFRAAERAFEVLAQVAGRAGRGLLGGQTVLQTYHPNHYAVQYAAVHDFVGFARRELAFRRRAAYPPFTRLARLLFRHPSAQRAEAEARRLAERVRAALRAAGLPEGDLIGPAPAFFGRVREYYRWQLLLRHLDPASFLRDLEIPADWLVDIDPVDIL